MELQAFISDLTGRVEAIVMKPSTFEEQQFMASFVKLFASCGEVSGSISVRVGKRRSVWRKRKVAQ